MTDRLVLSKGHSFSTDSKETGLNNNVAVIGCTGSGKTCSVVIPRLLNTRETNLVLTDPKRELVDRFAPMFRERGYNVVELNLDTPSKSDICFDPLLYTEKSEDISRLVSTLYSLLPECNKSDKFWTYSAELLTELLIRFTLQFKNNVTLADCLEECRTVTLRNDRNGEKKLSVAPVLDDFAKTYPSHPLTSAYYNYRDIADRTSQSVFITMRTMLSKIFNSEIEQMFRTKPTLYIDLFIRAKSVLFITTDGMDDGINSYVNLVYDTLLRCFMQKAREYPGGTLPIPVHVIMDDFACGAKIASFPRMITTFRSKGISSTIILQDESQLDAMYSDEEAKTIMNNNDTLVYLGGNDINTARDISLRLNVPLDEVLYMPLNTLLFFRRGHRPVKAERYPLFEDPAYLELTRENTGSKSGPER